MSSTPEDKVQEESRWDSDDIFTFDEWKTSDFIGESDFDMIDRLSAALDQVTHQLDEQKRELLQKSSEWTAKTKERLKGQTKKLEDQQSRIKELLVKQYFKIDKRMNRDAKTVRLRDKISFVVGVGNACIGPALALRYPNLIPSFYSVQFIILLMLRYAIYRSKRWHYFVFDHCYVVNVMTVLVCWVSNSRALFLATFALTNGPVALAIVAWRNSLVFHSLDKVTSVFIHIFPPLVMYCIRWMPELLREDVYCDNETFVTAFRDQRYPAMSDMDPSFGDMIMYGALAYGAWQILYYVFVMIKRREKVESGLRLTSYSWLLGSGLGDGQQGGFIQRVAFAFGPKWKLEMFALLQTTYSTVTLIPTYFLFKHFWLHSVFLVVMFAVSVWNGANYYIEVFSRRYILELENIKSGEKTA
jgi:hypothetical protein